MEEQKLSVINNENIHILTARPYFVRNISQVVAIQIEYTSPVRRRTQTGLIILTHVHIMRVTLFKSSIQQMKYMSKYAIKYNLVVPLWGKAMTP